MGGDATDCGVGVGANATGSGSDIGVADAEGIDTTAAGVAVVADGSSGGSEQAAMTRAIVTRSIANRFSFEIIPGSLSIESPFE